MQCDRCNLFTAAVSDIQKNLMNANCTTKQREEIEYIITSCKSNIEAWKAHLLRDANQDLARQEILESLDENSILLVSDWAMKYVPKKFRESQRDWFGKRGISWHLSVAIRKCAGGEMQMLTFVHIFENCSQESPAVLANFDEVFKCLKNVKPDVRPVLRNVYLKQDNAGCYHSATTMLLVQKVISKHSITLKRIDFSDPQGGKGSCDRKAALIKNHMKFYLNAGNDIETAEQMKSAIESSACIPGVHVSLCGPQSTSDLKVKWDGVSLINNVEYKDKEIKVWRAYGIGPGKSLSLSKFDLAKTLPKLNKISEHIAQSVPIKARKTKRSKITEKSKRTDNVLNSDHYDKSDDEDNDSDKDDDDGEDDDDDIHDHDDLEKGRGEKLYFCPHEGCIKSFQRHNSLENHLDCERHMYAIEHETLYDKAMKSYATTISDKLRGPVRPRL